MPQWRNPFLGEIRMVSFELPQRGEASCNGQVLEINQNQALFSLLGTTYGGNGRPTSPCPTCGAGSPSTSAPASPPGQAAGESHTHLTTREMPAHTHPRQACANARRPRRPVGAPGGSAGAASAAATTATAMRARPSRAADGRQPGAREPAAPPCNQLHHRPVWDLPHPKLIPQRRKGTKTWAEQFVAEIRIFACQLRADGLGAVQRPAAADHPEHGPLLVARHLPTGATARAPSACLTCRAPPPSIRTPEGGRA